MQLFVALLAVVCLTRLSTVYAQFGFVNPTPLSELIIEDEPVREGTTPPNVRFERIVAVPLEGENATDLIVIRNVGGQTADMTGWTLVDMQARPNEVFTFGEEGCEDLAELPPATKLELRPRTRENPCGFEFRINFLVCCRDGLTLFDDSGETVAEVSWLDTPEGTSYRILANGEYGHLPENLNVLETLEALDEFSVFLSAVETLNLTDELTAMNNPRYRGVELAEEPEAPIVVQFPSTFGFQVNRTELMPSPSPSPKPKPPKEGVPRRGPYTILAPTDAAFDNLRAQLAGSGNRPVSEEFLLELPELEDIILYHIIGGRWTSEFFVNNTPIFTAKGVEVVPFTDGLMNEGLIRFHDACIDKPTPDRFECFQQVDFNKCLDPFMTNPLGAEWQGGFCERTCGRCTCDLRGGSPCADVDLVDVMANNGVIHVVSRVLFPPPRFVKDAIAPAAETVLTGSTARTRRGSGVTAGSANATARPTLGIGVGFDVRGTEDETEEATVAELDAATEDRGRGSGRDRSRSGR